MTKRTNTMGQRRTGVWKPLLLGVCVLGLLCALTGCGEETPPQPAIPLEQETVTAALESLGLPGAISPVETASQAEGHIQYVIRDPEGGTEVTEDSRLIASVSCTVSEGGRTLSAVFNQSDAPEQMKWEDWKQQILLAATLYGGFEDAEEVYEAFLEKEIPEGKQAMQWDAELPGGYCTVSCRFRSSTAYDEAGFAVEQRSAAFFVNVYETAELYQELQEARTESKS